MAVVLSSFVYGEKIPEVEWEKTFGGADYDYGNSVQQTTDGGYIIAGRTSSFGAGDADVYLIKTDSNGNKQWDKTFGGINFDYAYSVQQTTDSGYIIAGYTYSFGAGASDAYLTKIDSNGNQQWEKTFGGINSDSARSVQQTTDGGYILLVETYSLGNKDVYILKTDSNGNKQWDKTFGGADYDYGSSVQQTTDGGYIIVGWTNSFGSGASDLYLIKTDSNGNKQWEKTFGGADYDGTNLVQQTSDNGYILAGSISFGATGYDIYLIKTDSNGNKQWNKTFRGAKQDVAYSVYQTNDNGYIITGYTYSLGAGNSDVYLIKTDSNGNKQWEKTIGTTNHEGGYSVQQTTDSGYVIAGYTDSFGAGWTDVYLIKLSPPTCIPLQKNVQHSDKLDVVFVPDEDYNGDLELFKQHVQDKIALYNSVSPIKEGIDKFNFYYTKLEGVSSMLHIPQQVRQDCSFADAFAILHKNDFGDAADIYHHTFSAEGADTKAFVHESGHAVFGLADEYEDLSPPYTYYFQPMPYPNIWSSLQRCQDDAASEGWNIADCRQFCSFAPACGAGWWKVDYDDDIMQRGYSTDGFGIACQRRINWKLSQTSVKTSPVTRFIKLIIFKFKFENGELAEIGSEVIYGEPPNYFNDFDDFTATSSLSNGTAIDYGLWDPRIIMTEDGSIFNESATFTLILPVDKYTENITVQNKTNDMLIAVDIAPALGLFCVNHSIEGDPDCIKTVNISQGWNLFSPILNPTDINTNRTIPLNKGWNLIGYSSKEPFNWSQALVNDGIETKTVEDAAIDNWLQSTMYYYEDSSFKLVPGNDEYLRKNKAYWVYSLKDGLTLTLPAVGGSLQTNTFYWLNTSVTDGTQNKTVEEAQSAGWLQATIYYYDEIYKFTPDHDQYIRPWRGYWLYSKENVTLVIND